jgi:hypothetical protein
MTSTLPRRCRKGHDWFPGLGKRLFIPTEEMCIRCLTTRVLLPSGQCLGDHPIADHYPHGTTPEPTADCPGPR